MPIYFIDTICPKGHIELNKKIIALMPNKFRKVVINSNGYYNFREIKDASFINMNLINFKSRMLTIFFTQLFNYLKIRFVIKDDVNQIKVFTTFENVSFIFAVLLFKKSKKVVFHHDNVDYLRIKYNRFFFKMYMNRISHFVFADFIKERLIEIGVDEKKVFVIQHPIPANETKISESPNENLYIGLGHASDNRIIKEIVAYENSTKILSQNRIKLILRSNEFVFKSEVITIINKHLSNKEYNDLYLRAKGVFMFYPKTFEYRFSGAMLDAFRNKKNIIGTNIPIIKHFNNLYPEMCLYFNTIPELFKLLITEQKDNTDCFNLFLYRHSDILIKNEFERIMKTI